MKRGRQIIGNLILVTAVLLGIGGLVIDIYNDRKFGALDNPNGTLGSKVAAVGGFLVLIGAYLRQETLS